MEGAELTCTACGAPGTATDRFCALCGTPRAGAGVLGPGALLDSRYRILSRLGEGGMSAVYLARHERLGREVAIKMLQPQLLHDESAVRRFVREARTVAGLVHPNVIDVFDVGVASGEIPYIVMEYVSGVSLENELAQRGAVSVRRATHILAQLASGLVEAHGRGLVHRDLKPGNLMLTTHDGDPDFVKILDFGIALSRGEQEESARLTRAGEIIGTPFYLAPEAWSGAVVDARADLYALGVVAYEMITGRLPFEGPTLPALAVQHLSVEPPVPSAVVPDASVLDQLVAACLSKRPENRPRDASEVLAALRGTLQAASGLRRRATYARAVGPTVAMTPDPTLYTPGGPRDSARHGGDLSAEIAALHGARRRHLRDLVALSWPTGSGKAPPDALVKLVAQTELLDRAAETIGEEIALLDSTSIDRERRADEKESELREEFFVASLALKVAQDLLPAVDYDVDVSSDETQSAALSPEPKTTVEPMPQDTAEARVARAERALDAGQRARAADRVEAMRAMDLLVSRLDDVEEQLRGPSEKLWTAVVEATRGRPDLRPALLALSKVDGALVSYQALLREAAPPRERPSSRPGPI